MLLVQDMFSFSRFRPPTYNVDEMVGESIRRTDKRESGARWPLTSSRYASSNTLSTTDTFPSRCEIGSFSFLEQAPRTHCRSRRVRTSSRGFLKAPHNSRTFGKRLSPVYQAL